MHVNACDSRKLAVAVIQPATKKYFNWATTGWETPFAPANHLCPLAVIDSTLPLMAPFLSADVGAVLLNTDVALLYFTVDVAGLPIQGVDIGTLPNPTANPVNASYSR
jgi:hypothetical protein